MRTLDTQQLALYLRCTGPGALDSVGGYKFESAGATLFETIEGDEATILGLPVLKVLSCLQQEGAVLR